MGPIHLGVGPVAFRAFTRSVPPNVRGSVLVVCAAKINWAYAAGPFSFAHPAAFFSSHFIGAAACSPYPAVVSATTASAVLP